MSSTTSARRRTRRCTAATIARASDSTSAGSSGAIASTSCASSSVRDALNTPGPGDPVVGEEVDVVACPRGERGKQQRGIHRPVQPRPAAGVVGGGVDADAAGRGASGVEHDHHPTVPLGPPRAHHHVGAPGGGAPVDRPDVVADHILAQRIELGALPADQHRCIAFELAEFGQPRRQVLADRNGGRIRICQGT